MPLRGHACWKPISILSQAPLPEMPSAPCCLAHSYSPFNTQPQSYLLQEALPDPSGRVGPHRCVFLLLSCPLQTLCEPRQGRVLFSLSLVS